MEYVNITIDGITVSSPPGTTILDAAAMVGIEIPKLCHVEGLRPSGNCRICVVEVEGSRTLVGSCHTPIVENMVIHSRSAKVLEARRATIELLLAGHTGSCVSDPEAKECGLHRLASDLEAGPSPFSVKRPRLYNAEEGKYVLRNLSRCILCRKCIRACREIAGYDIYSMAYRGFRSKVVVDCDIPLTKEVCKDCGVCIDHCPTSALMWPEGVKKREGSPSKTEKKLDLNENGNRARLLVLLKDRLRTDGHLSEESLVEIAAALELPVSEVYGVASFYSFLPRKPQGRNVIRICKSIPCYLKNAPMIIKTVAQEIGIGPGQTTADKVFSFELTNCIGSCDRAPAMMVNDRVYGDLTPSKVSDILRSYLEI